MKDFQVIRKGNFTLASGVKTDFYIDIKQALLTPATAQLIKDLLLNYLPDDIAVAGMGLGGTLMVGLMTTKFPGLIIREERKDHGTQAIIEGHSERDVILLEDVVTTGNSAAKAVAILRENGYNVREIVCVINRGDACVTALQTLEQLIGWK